MDNLLFYLDIVFVAVFLLLFVILMIAFFINRKIFSRFDFDKRLKYFSPEDFSLKFEVNKLDKIIDCRIYRDERVESLKKIVIFCHGIGAGHSPYMTEIATLAASGFIVAAPDYEGCGYSKGKRSGGFFGGISAVELTFDFLKSNSKYEDFEIYLVGHSWGAYSAMCASKTCEVDKVVAIGGFFSPIRTLVALLQRFGVRGGIAKFLSPFFAFLYCCCGGFFSLNGVKCLNYSQTKTLLIHGTDDLSIPLESAAVSCEMGENVEKLILEGKGHNPYNTVEAEQKLAQLAAALNDKNTPPSFFDEFDFKAATEEDKEVMDKIIAFLLEENSVGSE